MLDASVAAKWALPAEGERYREEALALQSAYLRGEVGLIVPDLFWIEYGSIFWKAVRTRRIDKESAKRAIAGIQESNIPSFPSGELLADAFALAIEFDRTIYDSIYVVLAIRTKVDMVTADERLVNALGARFPVRWLGALSV